MKKTKLVPITSLDQLEVESVIKSPKFHRKILAKCGELIWLNYGDEINQDENSPVLWDNSLPYLEPFNLYKLQNHDYQLEVTEEPWMPKEGESYYYPNTFDGTVGINETTWVAGNHGDNLRLKAGLVSKTQEEALAKAQKMLDSIKDSE